MRVKVKKLSRTEKILKAIKFFDINIKSQSSDGVIKTWDANKFLVGGCVEALVRRGLVKRNAIRVDESELGEMFSVLTINI